MSPEKRETIRFVISALASGNSNVRTAEQASNFLRKAGITPLEIKETLGPMALEPSARDILVPKTDVEQPSPEPKPGQSTNPSLGRVTKILGGSQ